MGGARMWAWRAHAYGGAVRLERARAPALRDPRHLLVRVHTAGLNPLDVAMLDGYGSRVLNVLRSASVDGQVEFPLVVGREVMGTVEAAGPGARARPGDRVWAVLPPHHAGAHAQYALVHDTWAGPAPTTLSPAAAGGALFAALSATAAMRAAGLGPRGPGTRALGARGPHRRALVLGLGAVGHAALQLLVAENVEVVVGCAGEQCAAAESLGAALALDRHGPHYTRHLVHCGPYDAIVDCAGLGGQEAGSRAWRFGRYVTLTSPLLRETDARGPGPGAAAAGLALASQAWRAAPNATTPCPPHVRWAFFRPDADDIEYIGRLAQQGRLVVPVGQVFPWWEAGAAYARLRAGPARGKLVLDFTPPRPPPPADTCSSQLAQRL